MNKKFKLEYILLSLILIVGFVVRLYKINNPIADWHSWRQADTASVSKTFVESGVNLLYPRYHDVSSIQTGIFNPEGYRMVEFPIYNAVHAGLFKIFPNVNLELLGRLLTSFISIISAVFIFLLGKKYANTKVGLLTAFFFIFLPFNIYFSRVVLPDPLGVLFAVAGLYFFEKSVVLSGLVFALALLQKPYFAFYLLPFTSFFMDKKNLRNTLTFAFLILAPFFAWRMWTSQFPEGIPFWDWAFNGDRIRFHLAFWKWLFGERLGIIILGGWGLILFAAALIKKNVNKFILRFLVGMFLYVSIVATANVKHDYYQTFIIPALSIFTARGVVLLLRGVGNFLPRLVTIPLAMLLLFLTIYLGWLEVKGLFQVNNWAIVEAGRFADKILPKEAVVVAPYGGDTAFLYQVNRPGFPVMVSSVDNLKKMYGVTHYVSVSLDADTKSLMGQYEIISQTPQFIILDLTRPKPEYTAPKDLK